MLAELNEIRDNLVREASERDAEANKEYAAIVDELRVALERDIINETWFEVTKTSIYDSAKNGTTRVTMQPVRDLHLKFARKLGDVQPAGSNRGWNDRQAKIICNMRIDALAKYWTEHSDVPVYVIASKTAHPNDLVFSW